jgi:hypothetical protein
MSFRCQCCRKAQPNGSKPVRVVDRFLTTSYIGYEYGREVIKSTKKILHEVLVCTKCYKDNLVPIEEQIVTEKYNPIYVEAGPSNCQPRRRRRSNPFDL